MCLFPHPGSGKGTFSQYLIDKYNYIQICPGDLFRTEIKAQTELGKKIQPIVEKGDYVEEKIVCELIAKHLTKALAQKKSFIIDGFPRSTISLQFLNEFLKRNNLTKDVCFLQFLAADETCIKRITERKICEKCFHVFNNLYVKPIEKDLCDFCKNKLAERKADTSEIAKSRLAYFHSKIEPLIKSVQESYEFNTIKTETSLQDLKAEYDALIQ